MVKNDPFGWGDSIMANRIRDYNWIENPLGNYLLWPLPLKLFVSQILSHQFPMLILWGPEFIQIHNDAFLFIRDPQEEPAVLGASSPIFFKENWAWIGPRIESVYNQGQSYFLKEQEYADSRKEKKGKTAYYTLSYSPLRNELGEIGGVMITFIEDTAQVESYRKLEEALYIQRLALESADMGSFQAYIDTGEIVRSKDYLRILGVPESLPLSEYPKLYYQDDLKVREEAVQLAHKTGKLNYQSRFIIHGEIRWIHVQGNIIFNSDKKPFKTIGVIQDITDQKIAETKILEANKKLQITYKKQLELQKQKDQFLQVASHALRTPITTIKGFGQVVEEILNEGGHTKEVTLVKKLNLRINHLHTLLENLFDITKINSGKLDFQDEVFELTELVKPLVEDLRFISVQHTILEEYNFKAKVKIDRFRLIQVVSNLLSNAVKYSHQGKEIRIRSRKFEDQIAVDIIDQGLGIPREELESIFEQYYRSVSLENTGIRGLGLGLFLSAEIIRRKGGKIWAESELGKGSTFTFSLPIFEIQNS